MPSTRKAWPAWDPGRPCPADARFNADVKPLPYHPDSAKALLQKAGVTNLAMTMIDPPAFGGASELKSQMEAIAADLGKVGIKVDTNLTDLAGYLAGTKDHDINVTVYGNSGNDIGVASLYFRRPPTTYQAPADPAMRNCCRRPKSLPVPSAEREAQTADGDRQRERRGCSDRVPVGRRGLGRQGPRYFDDRVTAGSAASGLDRGLTAALERTPPRSAARSCCPLTTFVGGADVDTRRPCRSAVACGTSSRHCR